MTRWRFSFVLETVEQALNVGGHRPSGTATKGSHFTSPQYTQRLEAAGVQISMDGRGRALDNIFTERFWRSLKYEEIYLHDYGSPREARQGITRYIGFLQSRAPAPGARLSNTGGALFRARHQLGTVPDRRPAGPTVRNRAQLSIFCRRTCTKNVAEKSVLTKLSHYISWWLGLRGW